MPHSDPLLNQVVQELRLRASKQAWQGSTMTVWKKIMSLAVDTGQIATSEKGDHSTALKQGIPDKCEGLLGYG